MREFIGRNKKKIKIITAIVSIVISLLAFSAVILFWGGIIVFANFDAASIIYMAGGIIMIPAFLYLLITQRRKFLLFYRVYNNPKAEKHTPKVMIYSLIKYIAVIFILLLVISISHNIIIMFMLPVYFLMLAYIFKYAKLWKYHGYSLLLLTGVSAVAVTASVLLSPFIRTVTQMLIT